MRRRKLRQFAVIAVVAVKRPVGLLKFGAAMTAK